MLRHFFIVLLFICSLYSAELTDNVRVDGFITLDATTSRSGDTRSELPTGGFETIKENETDYSASVFGLQLEAALTKDFSITTQAIVAKDEKEQKNRLDIELAFLTYDFGHDLKAQLGRMKVPFLMGTDLRHIGYSRIWTRAQVPPSGAVGFDEYNGLHLFYNTSVADIDLQFEFSTGKPFHEKPEEVKGKALTSFITQLEYDESWLRFSSGYINFDLDIPVEPQITNEDMYFTGIETEIKLDNFIFNGGYTKSKTKTIPYDSIRYGSLAYEFDNFTPYFLVSKKSHYFPKPAPAPPGRPQLKEEITDSKAYGIRYDLFNNTALKFQYEKRVISIYSPTDKIDSQNRELITFSIDVVF